MENDIWGMFAFAIIIGQQRISGPGPVTDEHEQSLAQLAVTVGAIGIENKISLLN